MTTSFITRLLEWMICITLAASLYVLVSRPFACASTASARVIRWPLLVLFLLYAMVCLMVGVFVVGPFRYIRLVWMERFR